MSEVPLYSRQGVEFTCDAPPREEPRVTKRVSAVRDRFSDSGRYASILTHNLF